jgi:hypothetical protein
MGRNSCRQCQERLAAVLHSTSFKHALYWLMRNLLKISRVTAGVNYSGFPGVTRLRAGGRESRGERCGIPHLAKNERDAPNFLYAALDRTACAPFFEERRMKFWEPTKLHRKSGMWGTRLLFAGKDERQTFDGASPGFPVNFIGFAEHHAAFLNESRTRVSC